MLLFKQSHVKTCTMQQGHKSKSIYLCVHIIDLSCARSQPAERSREALGLFLCCTSWMPSKWASGGGAFLFHIILRCFSSTCRVWEPLFRNDTRHARGVPYKVTHLFSATCLVHISPNKVTCASLSDKYFLMGIIPLDFNFKIFFF